MDIVSFLAGILVVLVLVIFVILGLLLKMTSEFSNLRGALNGFIANVSEKLFKIEQIGMATMQASETFVDALDNAMKEGSVPFSNNQQIFRTADGKHIANSIDEFIKKLESDPEYHNLADKIKEDLEDAIGNFNDDDDEDEEDSPKF
jgi:CHASE3 domain sensor protein